MNRSTAHTDSCAENTYDTLSKKQQAEATPAAGNSYAAVKKVKKVDAANPNTYANVKVGYHAADRCFSYMIIAVFLLLFILIVVAGDLLLLLLLPLLLCCVIVVVVVLLFTGGC